MDERVLRVTDRGDELFSDDGGFRLVSTVVPVLAMFGDGECEMFSR
jgi:hypothetical protein